jgi:hypothetical protein
MVVFAGFSCAQAAACNVSNKDKNIFFIKSFDIVVCYTISIFYDVILGNKEIFIRADINISYL